MAYSGLPSKACANCRIRRIKCNLLEPACSQCRRAGKECPGYRDGLSLMFRDENSKVIRKVHARTHAAERQKTCLEENSPQSQQEESLCTTSDGLEWRVAPSSSLMASPSSFDTSLRRISSPVEYQAINFFFHHYLSSCLPAQRDPLDVSIWPFWREVCNNKPFFDAVSSVGLAGLANVEKSQQIMKIARQKYASTLQQVMAAVKNPDQADLRYTIKAVMALALFEMVDCNPETAGSWRAHMGGAIALMKSGRSFQLEEIAEVKMKVQFCFSIFIQYVDNGERLPPTIAEWSRLWGASLSAQNAPAASLAPIVIRYIELSASIKAGELSIPGSILREALQLEGTLEEWRLTLPPYWDYTVEVSTDRPEATFNGQYHVYQDFWIERMWDHYRWVRILVHELILINSDHPPSFPEISTQQAESLAIISQLASDICTSVASVLYRLAPQPRTVTSPQRVGGVFMVIWTLRIAGGALGTSDALYEWVVGMLEIIGRTMGILRTSVAISLIKAHRDTWKRIFFYRLGENVEGYAQDVEALSDFGDID